MNYAQTKMMSWTSGRTVATPAHPGITCDNCEKAIDGQQVRYACLDCDDYDLCARCESTFLVAEIHFNGEHLFAKVRDSTSVDVKKYREAVKE